MEKSSGSGIRLMLADGTYQTLEEIVDEEGLAEVGEESKKENKFQLYYRPQKGKLTEVRDKRRITRIYTKAEIGKLNWQRRKMKITTNNMVEAVCELLVTHESYSATDMFEAFKEKGTDIDDVQKVRSKLGWMFTHTRLGYIVDTVADGRTKMFSLVPAAHKLSADDLMTVVYSKSKSKEDYRKLMESNKELYQYMLFKEAAEDDKEKKTKAVTEDAEPTEPKPIASTIEEVIGKAIADTLGVKVEVTGRIDIVFSLGVQENVNPSHNGRQDSQV